jgi:hypothetical protein
MKFEEILLLMRDGKKAQNDANRKKESFWICGEQLKSPILEYIDIPGIAKEKQATIRCLNKYNIVVHTPISEYIRCVDIMDESWEIME